MGGPGLSSPLPRSQGGSALASSLGRCWGGQWLGPALEGIGLAWLGQEGWVSSGRRVERTWGSGVQGGWASGGRGRAGRVASPKGGSPAAHWWRGTQLKTPKGFKPSVKYHTAPPKGCSSTPPLLLMGCRSFVYPHRLCLHSPSHHCSSTGAASLPGRLAQTVLLDQAIVPCMKPTSRFRMEECL